MRFPSVGVVVLGVAASAAAGLSCSSSATTAASGGGITGTLDGTWDITTAGSSPVGPSEMTVAGGSVTGFVANKVEGMDDPAYPGCTHSKYRSNIDVDVAGNTTSGTITTVEEWTGASCPAARSNAVIIAATRTRSDAASETDLNGDWNVTISNGHSKAQDDVVVIAGLAAQAWSKEAKAAGKPAEANISVANGQMTVTSSDRFGFAARRR